MNRPAPGELWRVALTGGVAKVRITDQRFPRHPGWIIFKVLRGPQRGKLVALPPPDSNERGAAQWKGRVGDDPAPSSTATSSPRSSSVEQRAPGRRLKKARIGQAVVSQGKIGVVVRVFKVKGKRRALIRFPFPFREYPLGHEQNVDVEQLRAANTAEAIALKAELERRSSERRLVIDLPEDASASDVELALSRAAPADPVVHERQRAASPLFTPPHRPAAPVPSAGEVAAARAFAEGRLDPLVSVRRAFLTQQGGDARIAALVEGGATDAQVLELAREVLRGAGGSGPDYDYSTGGGRKPFILVGRGATAPLLDKRRKPIVKPGWVMFAGKKLVDAIRRAFGIGAPHARPAPTPRPRSSAPILEGRGGERLDPRLVIEGLRRALHSFQGASERWAAIAARGATDEELLRALSQELGHWGGVVGDRERYGNTHQGGLKPRVIVGPGAVPRDPGPEAKLFEGRALLAATRYVLGIGDPTGDRGEVEAMQRSLRRREARAAGKTKRSRLAREAAERKAAAGETPPFSHDRPQPGDPMVGDVVTTQRERRGELQEQRYEVVEVYRDPFNSGRLEVKVAIVDYDGNGPSVAHLSGRQAEKLFAVFKRYGYVPGSGEEIVIPPMSKKERAELDSERTIITHYQGQTPPVWNSESDDGGVRMCSWCGMHEKADGSILPSDSTQSCPKCAIASDEGRAATGRGPIPVIGRITVQREDGSEIVFVLHGLKKLAAEKKGQIRLLATISYPDGRVLREVLGNKAAKKLLRAAKEYGFRFGASRAVVVPPKSVRRQHAAGVPVSRGATRAEQLELAREFPTFVRPVDPDPDPEDPDPAPEPAPVAAPAPAPAGDWISGVNLAAMDPSLHLIPATSDPMVALGRARQEVLVANAVRLRQTVMDLLRDGRARTFTAIAAELAGAAAHEAAGTNLESAVLGLVEDGYLEARALAPVLFRIRRRDSVTVDGGPVPQAGDIWIVTEQGVSWPGEVVSYDPEAGPFGGLVELRAVVGEPPRPSGEPQTVVRSQLVRLVQRPRFANPGRRR